MKNQLLQAIDNLKNFLQNIESIDKHPYSKGVDVTKLIKDLQEYANDLENMVNQIPDVVDTKEEEEAKPKKDEK